MAYRIEEPRRSEVAAEMNAPRGIPPGDSPARSRPKSPRNPLQDRSGFYDRPDVIEETARRILESGALSTLK